MTRINLAVTLVLVLIVGAAVGYAWANHRASDRLESCERLIAHPSDFYMDPGFDPSYSANDRHGDEDACLGHG